MINLLNNPTFDNERNVLNADLFVSNLHNTLKAFGFNPKVTYNVYRLVTIYRISWNDDKDYNDIIEYNKEIALALGVPKEELKIDRISDNEIEIKVLNMKRDILTLKELLSMYKKDDKFKVALGLDEEDRVIIFDFDKDKNLLVTGTSGSGKTNLFRNIIMNVLINYTDTKIIILDTQSINYNDFANVCEVVNGKDDVIKKIKLLRREFEERVKNGNRERILVFIDEIYEMLEMDNSVDEDINYLLSLGDKCNIHLIVSTDTLSNDDMVRIFTNNNTCKISFYMTTRGEYNIFLSNIVNESLNNDGMYLDSDKNLSRVIIPLIGDDEIERVVKYLNNK
ncbi:MAG: FtsK/SpoIIIE domain-containing protein [Bacilli bacterium]|nr:FtsK/SpoIIIE domain-containing protein [Bacilli bacterium]